MRDENLFEQLMYYIKVHLHNDDIMNLNNRIAEDLRIDWMYVYDNQDEDVVNDILYHKKPIEILRMSSSGEYNVGHDFVRFKLFVNDTDSRFFLEHGEHVGINVFAPVIHDYLFLTSHFVLGAVENAASCD